MWRTAAALAEAALRPTRAQWGYLEAVAVLPELAGAGAAAERADWCSPARRPEAITTVARPLPAHARVVATGGARGITYALVLALAQRRPLDLVILGRTPAVEPGASVLHGKHEAEVREAAKAALVAADERATPAAVRAWIEREQIKVEVAQNMAALRRLGCKVTLLACDVAHADQRKQAIDAILAAHLPVALLLHGAGFEQSRRIEDKEADALRRTLAPKTLAFAELWRALRPKRTVTMGSIAGRFGNAAQSDYAIANEGLSAHARLHPQGCLNLGWTAWSDIGMAERGSVRRVLEANGVVMMPRQVGVALGVQLIESTTTGDVVVAGPLGAMGEGERLLPPPFADCAVHHDEAGAFAALRRTFSPVEDVGLDHHRIDGTAVLPGVLGVELMVQAASWTFGQPVGYLRAVRFAAPIKFFRDRPLVVEAEVRRSAGGCVLQLCTRFTGPDGSVRRRLHFSAEAPLLAPARPELAPTPLAAFGAGSKVPAMDRAAIYRRYFHGPSFQVLDAGPQFGDAGVDATAVPEAANWLHDFAADDLVSRPWIREAGFQAAGLHEMAHQGRMALPAGIDELWLGEAETAAALPSGPQDLGDPVEVAARCREVHADGAVFDLTARQHGRVVDVMRGYRTVHLRPLTAAESLHRPAGATQASGARSGQTPASDLARIDRHGLALSEVAKLLQPQYADALAFYLSDAERQRLRQLTVKKRRLDWLAGRLAAKALLRRTWRPAGACPAWSAMTIAADASGEPEVLLDAAAGRALREGGGAQPRISISHSGDLALCVVSWDADCMYGIDVEVVQQRDPTFAATYFTAAEQAWAKTSAEPARSHTLLWAVKEAALKALGLAAQLDMRQLEVLPARPAGEARAKGTDPGPPPLTLRLLGGAAKAAEARGLEVTTVEAEFLADQVVAQVTVRRLRAQAAAGPRPAGAPHAEAARL